MRRIGKERLPFQLSNRGIVETAEFEKRKIRRGFHPVPGE